MQEFILDDCLVDREEVVASFNEVAADNVVGKTFATRGYQLLDHGLFDKNYSDLQDLQEAQIAGCRSFYSEESRPTVVDLEDIDEFVKERTEVPLVGDAVDVLEAIEWSRSPMARLIGAEIVNREGRFVLVY